MSRHRIPILAALILVTPACTEDRADSPSAVRVLDDTGRAVTLSDTPARIVSLAPSATSILVALDAAERIVARTALDHEPELGDLPVFSESLTPSAERIVDLRPDLVVVWPPATTPGEDDRLEAAGIPLYRADIETTEEILAAIARLGRLVDRSDRADSLRASIRTRIAATRRRVGCQTRPSVLYLVWHAPPYTVGSGSYVHEVIEAAGGRNAFADLDSPWGEVSEEVLLARNPDYLVVPQGHHHDLPLEALSGRPFSELSAVREGRVVTVDSDRFNRPGPEIASAVEELARALHPETCR